MAPRGEQIPNNQRCRHWFTPFRRCARYVAVLNGVIVNGYCRYHREPRAAQAAQAKDGEG
jgi:hypothetical protein